ncbi:MAG: pyridoxal phosphate-dependent aminotransferase [Sulfitobacter sp.]
MTTASPHIRNMSPYALAEMAAPPGKALISLAQNESLRGPSPKAIQAATECLISGGNYPDPDWTALRGALSAHHNIPADMILCGNGSLDLIGCLARAYAGPDRSVLISEHAYPFFRTAAQMANARVNTAPEVNETVSVDALLSAVQPDTGIVFVANPGNPTGTHIPKSDLVRLRSGLRDDILLVIDEAYGEFSDALNEPCWDMVDGGNCAVLRTFSKAYAMAGFRVGWGLFPDQIAQEMRKVMNPNNLTLPSQVAALAALFDNEYMRDTCRITADLREQATHQLRHAGFDVVPSVTNFVLIRFETEAATLLADTALRAQGIFLRRQQGAALPHALRMTIGPADATTTAIKQLAHWKETCI